MNNQTAVGIAREINASKIIKTSYKKVADNMTNTHVEILKVLGINDFLAKFPAVKEAIVLTEAEQIAWAEKRDSDKAYNSHVRELDTQAIVNELLEAAETCSKGDYYKRATSCMWAIYNKIQAKKEVLAHAAPTPIAAPIPAPAIPQTAAPTGNSAKIAEMQGSALDKLLVAVTAINNRLVALESKKPSGRPRTKTA